MLVETHYADIARLFTSPFQFSTETWCAAILAQTQQFWLKMSLAPGSSCHERQRHDPSRTSAVRRASRCTRLIGASARGRRLCRTCGSRQAMPSAAMMYEGASQVARSERTTMFGTRHAFSSRTPGNFCAWRAPRLAFPAQVVVAEGDRACTLREQVPDLPRDRRSVGHLPGLICADTLGRSSVNRTTLCPHTN